MIKRVFMESKIELYDVWVCGKKIIIVMRVFLCFIVVSYFCISCTGSKIEDFNKMFNDVERPVDKEQKAIISELKPVLLHIAKRMQVSGSGENVVYQSEEEFDEIDFTSLPYYELNENEFYEDPSPENLMNCIHPVKGREFFLGKKDGNVVIALEAINRDSIWSKGFSVEGNKYFEENFSWIHDRLIGCDDGSSYFLTFLERVYVGCTYGGEPCFFNFIGNMCFDRKSFAFAMLGQKKLKNSYEEYFDKMARDPEMMKQIEKERNMTCEEIQKERQKWEKDKK